MSIIIIAALILFGLVFLFVELFLLPGISIGGVISALCYGSAIYIAFDQLGVLGGVITIAVSALLSIILLIALFRSKTWKKLSLDSEITSTSSLLPWDELSKGDKGVALSRLSPMGKVMINNKSYEAKSMGAYIDVNCEVEVVDFENFSVVVRKVESNEK